MAWWQRAAALVLGGTLALASPGCTTGRNQQKGQSANGSAGSKILHAPLSFDPTSLDPARVPDIPSNELLSQIFEGLVRFNEHNQLEPALARRWEISPDGKTYTFHLRTGVKFHNGLPLTAADVKYSWERALAPATASGVAANYLDGVVGLKNVVSGRTADLKGVAAADVQTLRVTLDSPRAYFLSMLSYPTNYVVCRKVVEPNGGKVDEHALIGTGPFKFVSYQPGQSFQLTANPDYWDGKPPLDGIDCAIMVNNETAYNNFRSGQIDITGGDLERYTQDQAAGRMQGLYHVFPHAALDYIGLQERAQPLFKNRTIRRALLLAIDRDQILKTAYRGVGQVAEGVLPPDLPGIGKLPAHVRCNPAQARSLLAQAGFPGGKGFPPLTFTLIRQHPTSEAVAQIVRANLRDNLGIAMDIREVDSGEYFKAEGKGEIPFYFADWIADYPDPQNFISTLFVSTSSLDRSAYSNPTLDALCKQADEEPDHARRAELYSQANALLMDDAGAIPLAFGPTIVLAQPNVHGWRVNLCKSLPDSKTDKTAATPRPQ
jgi:ABC-type transport system substrate-binding protein